MYCQSNKASRSCMHSRCNPNVRQMVAAFGPSCMPHANIHAHHAMPDCDIDTVPSQTGLGNNDGIVRLMWMGVSSGFSGPENHCLIARSSHACGLLPCLVVVPARAGRKGVVLFSHYLLVAPHPCPLVKTNGQPHTSVWMSHSFSSGSPFPDCSNPRMARYGRLGE